VQRSKIRSYRVQLAGIILTGNKGQEAFMKKTVTAFGAVIGLAMLGACAPSAYDDYGYRGSYYSGSAYYGPDYYGPNYDPYYRGGYYGGGYYSGGVYVAPRDHDRGGYRRGDRDGRRDNARNDDRDRNNDGRRDYRGRDGQNDTPRPPGQSQQQWQPQPGVSPRAQMFGGGNAAPRPAPPPAASMPAPNPPSGWNGFQGRNPNDPNNTD
jgi:hypothetical protein